MGLDKTKTIKQRRIDVYLPTLDAKERWNREAEKRRVSVSEMVFELVETGLAAAGDDSRARVTQLEGQVADLTNEIGKARARIQDLEALHALAEKDLEEYRAEAFLGTKRGFQLDARVVRLLSEARGVDGKHRAVDASELRKSFRITGKDEKRAKALAEQLEYLELHRIISKTARGWVWNE
ncbi:MAG TPA: hypothetical protein VNZ52_07725 [Candidatus Thermoplasmatota archaeon]|nr:hypothetical protein [Candidatus Thermoplasmatota archaeon]